MKVEELLNLIACPKCHAKLRVVDAQDATGQTSGLLCESCKLLFAYDDGLPNMLISEARTWPPAAAPRST
ncbi:MAG TPA: Trm112 family protein [Polyangiales bacterium]|nr:Trm112 family protein [Polyangiales bacterium]